VRALIYTRVSDDRAGGRSPREQEEDARQVCQRNGWTVIEPVLTDSKGASRHSKGRRDDWTKARTLIQAGNVDVLVTWEASRAQRDLEAYAELRQLCATNGVLWNYSGRTYDLTNKDDRFATGLDALLAEREADETSSRVRRAVRANAAAGRPHGRRLFGYERTYDPSTGRLTGQQPHPTEAATVHRIYDEYLAGTGIRTIANHLNRDGITTSTGIPWRDSQVRRVILNPAYAALRVHNGQIIGDATWPQIINRDTWDRAQALTEARRTRNTRYSGTARLLTGVARCGICGGKVAVIHDRRKRKVYICRDKFEVARDEKKVDAYVTEALLRRLRQQAHAPQTDDQAAAEARAAIDAERAKLDAAVDQYSAGKLSASTLARVEQRILAAIAEHEKQIRRSTGPAMTLDVPADEAEAWAWWESLDRAVQRSIAGDYIAAVVIRPVGVGKRTFNPDAIKIEFR
jgi:DNA invertase Pin-like site-specific DNA recombinase